MNCRIGRALALIALAGCANLPVTGDGVVAIEVVMPASLLLRQGESVQMEARAFDASGSVVEADIRWFTSDTTVSVDETTGLVTGLTESGIGRVQARIGTLSSDLISFTLQPAPVEDEGDQGDT
ncbi:MAG TPA: Ig-like domain-containing protein [Gemmatimonadales bacterium]|nr:Ig-like domain-containing protein [Gemmatimonadales bacterium]